MNCPTCNTENAYVSLFSVECPNHTCKHYNPPVLSPTSPKSKRIWLVQSIDRLTALYRTPFDDTTWNFCYVTRFGLVIDMYLETRLGYMVKTRSQIDLYGRVNEDEGYVSWSNLTIGINRFDAEYCISMLKKHADWFYAP